MTSRNCLKALLWFRINLIHTFCSTMKFKMYHFSGSQFDENDTYFFDGAEAKPKTLEVKNPPVVQIPVSELKKNIDSSQNFFSKLFHLKIEAFTIEQLVSLC